MCIIQGGQKKTIQHVHAGVSTENLDRFLPNFARDYKDQFEVRLPNMANLSQFDSMLRHIKATQPLIHSIADLFKNAAIILKDHAISSKSSDFIVIDYAT